MFAYCRDDGTCQIDEFLAGLQERERKQMLARIAQSAENGPPRNREANKAVEGTRYFEFKTDGQRIFWRWSRRNEIILMQGFSKQQHRIPGTQIDTADRLFGTIERELDEETQ